MAFQKFVILKKSYMIYLISLLGFFIFSACDLLNPRQFEIISWYPGEGFHEPANIQSVSMEFSNKPDIVSVEHAFSFTENGAKFNGKFKWENNFLIFYPYAKFEENSDYILTVNTDAQDKNGISLEKNLPGCLLHGEQKHVHVLSR
jgi:hypothetical protein